VVNYRKKLLAAGGCSGGLLDLDLESESEIFELPHQPASDALSLALVEVVRPDRVGLVQSYLLRRLCQLFESGRDFGIGLAQLLEQ